tara:strand:+ start:1294 stop:1461 length:168 start_codon:yes stop_codon:yes gene_type:complete
MPKKAKHEPSKNSSDYEKADPLELREYARLVEEEEYKPTDPLDYESRVHGRTRRI